MLNNKLTYNVGCLRRVCAEVKSWDTVVLRFQNDAAPSSFDPLLSAFFFNIFFLSPPFFTGQCYYSFKYLQVISIIENSLNYKDP